MKKVLSALAAALVIVFFLSGCSFTTNFSDNTGTSTMEAADKVETMVAALTDGDADAALELMHPNRTDAETGIKQMCEYMAGRKVVELNHQNLRVSTKSGNGGDARQESAAIRAELEDGTVIFFSVVYLTDSSGEGFASFQLVLGVI